MVHHSFRAEYVVISVKLRPVSHIDIFQIRKMHLIEIAREKVRRAAVQYVPATAVLRALEVEKRVRDAAAAITVNRHATESI